MRGIPFRLVGPFARFLAHGNFRAFAVFTHLTIEERLVLYRLALTLNGGDVIVEVGSYLGASSCFLGAAAMERGSKVFCVDTWKNDGMTEGPRDTYSAFLKNIQRYQATIVPLRMTSEEAAREFQGSVNMLFLDGGHDYRAVSSDLSQWLPRMKDNGWLVLHDSGWAEGVQRAIKEVVSEVTVSRPLILPNLHAVRIDRQHSQKHRVTK